MMLTVDEVKRRILPILRRHGVRKSGLFGSFARGESGDDSDIDLLVEIKKEQSLLEVAGLKLELEEALGRNVDLVEYDMIRPFLRRSILAEQVVIL